MKKTAFLLMLMNVLIKILGLLNEMTLANYFGATTISDAYLIALTIPTVIFSFVGVAVNDTFIPIYESIRTSEGVEKSKEFTNNIVNIILLASVILIFIVCFGAEPIVKMFAVGFSKDTLSLAAELTQITIFSLLFISLLYIFVPLLQVNGYFVSTAFIGFPLNIILILSIFFASTSNIKILGYGKVIATFSQVLVLVPTLRKLNYNYRFTITLKDKYIKKMLLLASPVLLGTSVNQINILVDRTMASIVTIGGVSVLNYANKLNLLIQSVVVLSIVAVIYPKMTNFVMDNNISGFKNLISESMVIIVLLIVPASVGIIVFHSQIVQLLFARGLFDNNALNLTSTTFLFYSFGMFGMAMREILTRAFYSLQDTKTPMINSIWGLVINIVLNVTLSKLIGIPGLALATSIAATATTIFLFIDLRRRIGSLNLKNTTMSFIKVVLASLIMGVLAKISYNLLIKTLSNNISLVISVFIGVIIYLCLLYIMKIEEFNSMSKLFRNR